MTDKEFEGVANGKRMGLGNAQRAEVQFLVDNNIPFYLYSIEEYQELIDMAKQGRAAPEERRGKFSIEEGPSIHAESRATPSSAITLAVLACACLNCLTRGSGRVRGVHCVMLLRVSDSRARFK